MAYYGIKYKAYFWDEADHSRYEIQLKKRDYTGVVSEVTAAAEPYVKTFPGADKFAPVKGAGCEIRLFSEEDRQFIDLYTADHKEWRVDVYKDGAIDFMGYVDPETYNEPFDLDSNYDVTISCNNGINVLERENYVGEWGENYKGLATIYQVLLKALAKMELPFRNIVFACDLRVNRMWTDPNKIILQYLTVNQDNYIDEDDVVMTAREVIESILAPFTLTLLVVGQDVWIVDYEYLKKGTINIRTAAYGGSVFSTSQINVEKDIAGIDQVSSSFQLEGGVNFYKLKRNRHVLEILEEIDFDDDSNYTGGDASSYSKYGTWADYDVVGGFLGDFGHVGSDLWLIKYQTFRGFEVNTKEQLPNSTDAYMKVAHPGGYKAIKVVDNVTIAPNEDDVDFNNYIFINNPYKKFEDYVYPDTYYSGADADLPSSYDILKEAFRYAMTTPFLFPSIETFIQISFIARMMSGGVGWSDDGTVLYYQQAGANEYSTFKGSIGIYFKDNNGNIAFSVTDNGAVDSPELQYSLIAGSHKTYYVIDDINEAGNKETVLNKDIEVKMNIPADFGSIYRMEVIWYNEYYRVKDGVEIGDIKETIPYLAIKDVNTNLTDIQTGEERDLSDEEMQFFLSDKFKSESITDELTTYSADPRYIADVAGINVGADYIESASANGITVPDLEMLKGDKMVRQYQDNQVVLTISFLTDDIPLYSLLTKRGDAKWGNKQWIITGMSHNVKARTIEVTLEEIK